MEHEHGRDTDMEHEHGRDTDMYGIGGKLRIRCGLPYTQQKITITPIL